MDTTVPLPRDDADDSASPSTVFSGLVVNAASKANPMGTATPTESNSFGTTTTSTGATDTNASESIELLPQPVFYANVVDPRVTTVTTSIDTHYSESLPPPHLLDFSSITSPMVTDSDLAGFKVPRRQRQHLVRETTNMHSRSQSSSSTDSASSSDPTTRKQAQPSSVGTGHTSRRSSRDINITLGQFGAFKDLVVTDNSEVPDIRLSGSGNLLPNSPPRGNLGPRPPTELDSSLEPLLRPK